MATVAKQEKLYTSSELPKVAGGLKIGTRKLAVITGTSSGLGLACLKALLAEKKHFVVCAVRDVQKMNRVAKEEGLDTGSIAVMKLELGNLQSVRDFVQNLRAFKLTRPLDYLVCNAAVYLPKDPEPRFTDDGIEQSLGINHVGHFLLARLLIDDLKKASDPRCVIVGSITGNTNTIGGGLVYPRADLGDLSGLKRAADGEKFVQMADGNRFFGAKAYKDSKVCNMMTMYELHQRYHDSTGINFSSMYPGCIAETALFREKREWFRTLFPLFMKYVTGGYVSEKEAGERLAQVRPRPSLPIAPRPRRSPSTRTRRVEAQAPPAGRPPMVPHHPPILGTRSASRTRSARSRACTGAGTAMRSSLAWRLTSKAARPVQVRLAIRAAPAANCLARDAHAARDRQSPSSLIKPLMSASQPCIRAGRARASGGAGGSIFENELSEEVKNREKSIAMWEYTSKLVGLPA
jgi:protochlorophyllide reductase